MSRAVLTTLALALAPAAPALAASPSVPSPVIFSARERPHGRVAMTALDPRTLRARGSVVLRGEAAGVAAPSPDRRRVLLGTQRTERGGSTHVLTLHTVRVAGVAVERTTTLRTQAEIITTVWRSRRRALVLAADADPAGEPRTRVFVVDPLRGRVVTERRFAGAPQQTLPYGGGLALLIGVGRSETPPRDVATLDADGRLGRRVRVPLAGAGGAWEFQRDPQTGHVLVLDDDRPNLADVDLRTGKARALALPITGRSFSFVGPAAIASADARDEEGSGPGGVFFLRPGTHEVLATRDVAAGSPVSPAAAMVQVDLDVRAFGPSGEPLWHTAGFGIGVGPYVYVSRFSRAGDLTVRDATTGERLASLGGFRTLQIPSLGYDVSDAELPTA